MAEGAGHKIRMRLRLHAHVEPQGSDLVPGAALLHTEPDDRGVTAVVECADDRVVAELVRAWSARWPLTAAESTADSLEEAFRDAVMGTVDSREDVPADSEQK
jgi:ABC-2 type transport system ATP-binding protein